MSATSAVTAVGDTPLVALQKDTAGRGIEIHLKLEWFNPTGSCKDRMALAMIEGAERRGALEPGMTVVEYTGGSTGSSLAFVCAAKGYRFHAVSSDAFAEEKLRTMRAFGAELTIVPSTDGRITPDLIPRMRQEAERLADRSDTYFTDQFHNTDHVAGYRHLGEELLAQFDAPPDVFCVAVGTAGLLMGIAEVLRAADGETRIVALEPATSAVISGGEAGPHHVEGIGVGFVPPLLREELYDDVLPVDETLGRETARRLASEDGIFAGTSTGLNVAGAMELGQRLEPDQRVVTVAVDSGLKYLAGDLYPT